MMGSPDYTNWPTNGPFFDAGFLGGGCTLAFCANPNWQSGGIVWHGQDPSLPRTATLRNTPTWTARGLHCAQAADETAVIASSAASQPGTSDYSIVAYYIADSWPDTDTLIVDNRGVGAPFTGWAITRNQAGGVTTGMHTEVNGAGRNFYQWNTGLPIFAVDGNLKFCVLSCDRSASATPYLNGTMGTGVNIAGSAGQVVVGINSVKIAGHHADANANNFDGTFLAFLFFKRALQQSEIEQWSADPLRPFRRKEIAYFFGPSAAPPAFVPYPFSRGLRGGVHVLSGGLS